MSGRQGESHPRAEHREKELLGREGKEDVRERKSKRDRKREGRGKAGLLRAGICWEYIGMACAPGALAWVEGWC